MPYLNANKLTLLSGITTYKEAPDDVFFAIVDEDGGASSICTRVPGGRCVAMVGCFTTDGKFHGNTDGLVSFTPDPDTRIQVLMIVDWSEYPANTEAPKPSLLRRLIPSWGY